MTFITSVKNNAETYPKNSLEKTIDGRSPEAIMAVALKLSRKPRVDWPNAKTAKNI